MPGRGKVGADQRARAPLLLKKVDGQARLKPDPVERANLRQETKGRAITSHEHVLAVIDHAAGHRVDERPRAPAQVRFLLEDPNAPARARQRHARRQARQSPTHDQDVIVH